MQDISKACDYNLISRLLALSSSIPFTSVAHFLFFFKSMIFSFYPCLWWFKSINQEKARILIKIKEFHPVCFNKSIKKKTWKWKNPSGKSSYYIKQKVHKSKEKGAFSPLKWKEWGIVPFQGVKEWYCSPPKGTNAMDYAMA
jgi:hypothetical protein